MIETDRGDDSDLGKHHVGGIEFAAHTHFDDTYVAVSQLKLQESHRGHELKKTGMIEGVVACDFFGDTAQVLRVLDELGFGEDLPIHLNTFAEADEVR